MKKYLSIQVFFQIETLSLYCVYFQYWIWIFSKWVRRERYHKSKKLLIIHWRALGLLNEQLSPRDRVTLWHLLTMYIFVTETKEVDLTELSPSNQKDLWNSHRGGNSRHWTRVYGWWVWIFHTCTHRKYVLIMHEYVPNGLQWYYLKFAICFKRPAYFTCDLQSSFKCFLKIRCAFNSSVLMYWYSKFNSENLLALCEKS